jgi:hypothetical protein
MISSILRYVPSIDKWLSFFVSNDFLRLPPVLMYESNDCTGTPYAFNLTWFPVNPQSVYAYALVSEGGQVYYPTGAAASISVQSQREDASQPCFVFQNPGQAQVFPKGSFPLSELGLTAPFRLSR